MSGSKKSSKKLDFFVNLKCEVSHAARP